MKITAETLNQMININGELILNSDHGGHWRPSTTTYDPANCKGSRVTRAELIERLSYAVRMQDSLDACIKNMQRLINEEKE
jgi:hypothetical protein